MSSWLGPTLWPSVIPEILAEATAITAEKGLQNTFLLLLLALACC